MSIRNVFMCRPENSLVFYDQLAYKWNLGPPGALQTILTIATVPTVPQLLQPNDFNFLIAHNNISTTHCQTNHTLRDTHLNIRVIFRHGVIISSGIHKPESKIIVFAGKGL
jgi:hypothetical protein